MRFPADAEYVMVILFIFSTSLFLTGRADELGGIGDQDRTILFPTEGGALCTEPPASMRLPISSDGSYDLFSFGPFNGELLSFKNISCSLELNCTTDAASSIEVMIDLDSDGNGGTDASLTFPLQNISGPAGKKYYLEWTSGSFSDNITSMDHGYVHLGIRDLTGEGVLMELGGSTFVEVPYDINLPFSLAGPDIEGFTGVEVCLNGSSSYHQLGKPINYLWDLDTRDGLDWDLEGPVVNHTYLEEGSYTVTLNVTDGNRWDHDTLFVNITLQRPPTIDMGEDRTLSREEDVFIGSGSSDEDDDPLTYLWELGDGRTFDIENIYVSWAYPGVYNVNLTVTDGHFVVTDSIVVTVVNRFPDPTIELDNEPLFGCPIIFNATHNRDPDGDNLTYRWSFDGEEVRYGPVVNFTFDRSGDRSVTLFCNDTYGTCSVTRTFTVPENGPPVPVIAQEGSVFTNRTASFNCHGTTDPEGHEMTFSWRFPDGSVQTGVEAEYTFTSTGTFDVVLTVTDVYGGTAEDSLGVDVLRWDDYYPLLVRINTTVERCDVVQMPYTYSTYELRGYTLVRMIHQAGGYRTYVTDLPGGYYNLEISVRNGSGVDILCFESRENYLEYTDQHTTFIEYDRTRSKLHSMGINFSFRGSEELYIVVDNNDRMAYGAIATENVTYTLVVSNGTYIDPTEGQEEDPPDVGASSGDQLLVLVCFIILPILVIILIIAFSIFSILKKRRAPEPELPPDLRKEIDETIKIGARNPRVPGTYYELDQAPAEEGPLYDDEEKEGLDILDRLTMEVDIPGTEGETPQTAGFEGGDLMFGIDGPRRIDEDAGGPAPGDPSLSTHSCTGTPPEDDTDT